MKIFEKFPAQRRKKIMKVPYKRIPCIKISSIKQPEKWGETQFKKYDLSYGSERSHACFKKEH